MSCQFFMEKNMHSELTINLRKAILFVFVFMLWLFSHGHVNAVEKPAKEFDHSKTGFFLTGQHSTFVM